MNKLKRLLHTQTLKDSLISFVGHVGSALINLVFFAMVTRKLGPELFGLFALCMTTTYLIKDFVDIAMDSALLRFVPQAKIHLQQAYLKQILITKVIYITLAIILGGIFRDSLSQLIFHQSLPGLILLTTIWSLTQSLVSFTTTVFQARKNFSFAAQLITGGSLTRLILLFISLSLNYFSVASLITISFLADIIIFTLAISIIGANFLSSHPPTGLNRRLLKFGLPLVATSASGILSDKVNVYITNYYSTPAQVGLLTAAVRLFTPVQSLSGSLSRVFGSRQASFASTANARLYLYKSLSLSAILASGLIFTSLFSETIIGILYGPDFMDASLVFQILTFGFGLFLLQVPLNSYLLYYLGRSDYMAYLSLVQLVVIVVLNFMFIPRFGITGAAIAFSLSIMVSVLTTAIFSHFSVKVKP